jgi:hypothetical protein
MISSGQDVPVKHKGRNRLSLSEWIERSGWDLTLLGNRRSLITKDPQDSAIASAVWKTSEGSQ